MFFVTTSGCRILKCTVCVVHTQQEGKMHHSLLVLYTPKVGGWCLTSPWWPSISAGEICLEHVCFRITCWFDSRKQLSRVKKFHRVYSFEGFMRFQRFSSKVSRSFFGNTSGKSILDTNFAAEGLVESVGWLRRMLFPLLMAESYSIETSFKLFLICWIFVEKTISYYDICCFFWWIDCYRKCCEKLHLSGQWGACDAAWKEMGLGEPRLQQWQVERNTWTTEEIENKHSNNDVCCRYIYIYVYIFM